jgi:signal transduction histidine kinase
VLVVADDGPGIPAADRERVLERFTRLDDARGQDAGGAGFGLAIIHEIVCVHRGEVTIRDTGPTDGDGRHGSGARFVVGLPAEQAAREVQRQPPMLVPEGPRSVKAAHVRRRVNGFSLSRSISWA